MARGIRLPGREAKLVSLAERVAESRSLTAATMAATVGMAVMAATDGAVATAAVAGVGEA
jgi:hypothetical protein